MAIWDPAPHDGQQFEYVARVDGTATWLNTFRLFAVVVIPFTTSIASEYEDLLLGRVALPINFLLAVVAGAMQWWYVTSPKRDLVVGLDQEERRRSRFGAAAAVAVSLLVVAASPWVGSLAFLHYLALPLADRVSDRMSRAESR